MFASLLVMNQLCKNILLVDDEKPFLLSLSEALEFAGDVKVQTAENGREALESLQKGLINPDLLVTDLKMPEMDGYELLERARKIHPDLPVIVLTACMDDDSEERLKQLGVAAYIEKPLDFEQLSGKIFAILGMVPKIAGDQGIAEAGGTGDKSEGDVFSLEKIFGALSKAFD